MTQQSLAPPPDEHIDTTPLMALEMDRSVRAFGARATFGRSPPGVGLAFCDGCDKWDAQRAAADGIERTSTEHAPWTLIEASDKHHARVKALSTLVRASER